MENKDLLVAVWRKKVLYSRRPQALALGYSGYINNPQPFNQDVRLPKDGWPGAIWLACILNSIEKYYAVLL